MRPMRWLPSDALQGIHDAFPIVLAYFPIAVAYGVVATSQGLSSTLTVLTSVVIYGGASQFILVDLASARAAPLSLFLTVVLVNVRYLIYGGTLGLNLKHWKEWQKWFISFGVTDEVFAVTASRMQSLPLTPIYQFLVSLLAYLAWVGGSIVGAGAGHFVSSSIASVLTFTLPALFLALLLAPRRSSSLAAGICGAAVSVLAQVGGMMPIGLLVGALAGTTVGWLLSRFLDARARESQRMHSK